MSCKSPIVATLLATSILLPAAFAQDAAPEGTTLAVSAKLLFCDEEAQTTNFIAGEQIALGIRVTGLQADQEGYIDTLARAELLDGSGRIVSPLPPKRIHQILVLGEGELNCDLRVTIPADCSGKHTIRVTIDDQNSGNQVTNEQSFAVADSSTFGLTNVRTALDDKGKIPSDVFPIGRTLYVFFSANGYPEENGNEDIEVTVTITDAAGESLFGDSIRNNLRRQSVYGGPNRSDGGMYVSSLNRSGRFWLKLHAKDLVSGKEAVRVVPFFVATLNPQSPVQETAAGQPPIKR